MKIKNQQALFWGVIAGLFLILFYIVILSLTNSVSHPLEQFKEFWYWIVTIIFGFSVQVGIYTKLRQEMRERERNLKKSTTVASGGISAGSMIACCSHHLIDVLPIIGLSAAFLFIAKYQLVFLLFGIFGNLLGIIYLLEIWQREGLPITSGGIMTKILKWPLKRIRKLGFVVAVLILIIVTIFIALNKYDQAQQSLPKTSSDQIELPVRTFTAGELNIQAKPLIIEQNAALKIQLQIDTHSGDLNQNLAELVYIINEEGEKISALSWNGGQGGHHLTGILTFPPLGKEILPFALQIINFAGVAEINFNW